MAGPRVAVLGGGLAGIAAALDCAQAGAEVTLVEVRPRLGGAIYSFERDGLTLDNGQHVFLRCCHAYRALLRRLGSERLVQLQSRLEIPVLSPDGGGELGGKLAVLRRSARLPAPAHLAGALLRYRHLRLCERVAAARAALALARLDPADPALDERTLGSWLAEHGQSEAAIAALWDLIALPTLNLPAAQASLGLGAFVFRTGLLASAEAGDIGFHAHALSEIVGEPAKRALREAGVQVRLGWRARSIHRRERGFAVAGDVTRDGAEDRARQPAVDGGGLDADAVVVALPHERAAALIESLAPRPATALRGLGSSPIVNLHVLYDRPVWDLSFAAGVRTPVQYLFDRSAASGLPAGRYLAVSLSGAEREMALTPQALRERYLPALAQLLPRARAARVESFAVTREHAATFRAAPGSAALRPGPYTEVPGLVLAGAFTATGWPATLEGAVLSGHAAADAALASL